MCCVTVDLHAIWDKMWTSPNSGGVSNIGSLFPQKNVMAKTDLCLRLLELKTY